MSRPSGYRHRSPRGRVHDYDCHRCGVYECRTWRDHVSGVVAWYRNESDGTLTSLATFEVPLPVRRAIGRRFGVPMLLAVAIVGYSQ